MAPLSGPGPGRGGSVSHDCPQAPHRLATGAALRAGPYAASCPAPEIRFLNARLRYAEDGQAEGRAGAERG